MIAQATVTSKGQITLPKSVREALGTQAGSKVMFFVVDGRVELRVVKKMRELYGSLKVEKYVDFHEARDEAKRIRALEAARQNGIART